jgi:hypothetical protein
MLNDEDYRVRDKVRETLPKIIDIVQGEQITAIYNILLANISKYKDDKIWNLEETRKTVCICLGKLVPKLSQSQSASVKDALIIALDDENRQVRIKAFKHLTQMAYLFSGDELAALIITLADKTDVNTCKYILNITHLINKVPTESQNKIIECLFKTMESEYYYESGKICLSLAKLAPHLSSELTRRIISKFIAIASKLETDMEQQIINTQIHGSQFNPDQERSAALNGLIMLSEFMTAEERETFLNQTLNSFEMIAAQDTLKIFFDIEISLNEAKENKRKISI